MVGSGARPGKHTIVVGPGHDGERLDRVLVERLAADGIELSRKAVQRLVVSGSVSMDGRVRTFPSATVVTGSRLVCDLDRDGHRHRGPGRAGRPDADRAAATPVVTALGEDVVRYEDDWIIVVDKPAGLPTHATIDPGRPHLHGLVAELLARRDGAGDERPYLAVHHRLDRDTTGLVLFAKDRSANAALAEAFAGRQVVKEYLAVCRGTFGQGSWTVRDHLGRLSPPDRTARYGRVRSGGSLAETGFRVVRRGAGGTALVEARPRTGRTHQIRVHLAGGGTPIVGDELYGGAPGPRVLLHARGLSLPHPCRAGTVSVQAPTPEDMRLD
jgi:23S rRNA pseudouridine1911/1915/1917 synthase